MFGFMNFQSSIPLYLKNKLKNLSSFRNSSRLERNFFSIELILELIFFRGFFEVRCGITLEFLFPKKIWTLDTHFF